MTCLLLTCAFLAALPSAPRVEETVIRVSVHPMAAPKPVLTYQLLPEVRELEPGNAAQWFLRCFAEQRNFFYGKEAVAQRARYHSVPLAKLRGENLGAYGGSALKQADWAARLNTVDWEVLQRLRTDGLAMQTPELEPLRVLGQALQVRFRGRVAGNDFAGAVENAKTMFALARDLGQYPAEPGNRVGLDVASLTTDSLEEMVQQPGCPNLYWALADLPHPLVDLHQGLQGERALVDAEVQPLRDDRPMTTGEIEELIGRLSGRIGYLREQTGRPPRSLRIALRKLTQNAEQVRAARQRLAAAGCAADANPPQAALHFLELARRFQQFPAAQVILLDAKRDYANRRDEALKLLALEPRQIAEIGRARAKGQDIGPLDDLIPDVVHLRELQARLEQRLAILRAIEALRLHAASHGGRLPTTLADVSVPVPGDPVTGEPFRYRCDRETAHLYAGSLPGKTDRLAYNLHYEITVR